MEEVAPGVWHWTAKHPRIGVDVSSYYLADSGVLLDPLAPDSVADRLEELGPPRRVLLTNRHHWRDCPKLIERFGVTVGVNRESLHEFGDDQPVEAYDFGDELAEGAVISYEVGSISPDEGALHIPGAGALAVADGVMNYDGLQFVPDNLMDDPEQTKAGLRAAYVHLTDELDFDHLLTAHGEPVVGGARDKLRDFAENGG